MGVVVPRAPLIKIFRNHHCLKAERILRHSVDFPLTFFRYDLQAATFGHGVDVIVEMLANVNLGRDLQMLKRNGRLE